MFGGLQGPLPLSEFEGLGFTQGLGLLRLYQVLYQDHLHKRCHKALTPINPKPLTLKRTPNTNPPYAAQLCVLLALFEGRISYDEWINYMFKA